jgi:hypothetical protein
LQAEGRTRRTPYKQKGNELGDWGGAPLTSKQSEFTSDLGSRSRLSIFSNRVSKLSPVDMLLLLNMTIPSVPAPAAEKQFQPTSSALGSQQPGGGAGTSGSPGAPGSPPPPFSEVTSALQTPGWGRQRPTAARMPKVASHPAALRDSRQRRRQQPRPSFRRGASA